MNVRPTGSSHEASPREAARSLLSRVREAAGETERGRRVPPTLVAAMASAGLFRLCVPKRFGGLESDVETMVRVVEDVAGADGSTGWALMIGITSGLVAGYLPEDATREIYGTDPNVVTGGVFAPKGKAIPVDGGYRVSGRWPFASGSQHCAWLMGGCLVLEGGKPRLLPSGAPDSRMALFPASEAKILDTWTVSGLRGTGSHDFEVGELFVPAARTVSLATDPPRETGPLYRFPVFGLLALGIAAVATGIARAALDEIGGIAREKVPTGARKKVADRPVAQTDFARATATLGSARAFLFEAIGEAWGEANAGGEISLAGRAKLRLAATHAARAAAEAVDRAWDLGGGTAVYESSPLARRFRDVHVATQHLMVAPPTWELVGRILLGVETDPSML